jgi:hypothetical protein
MTVVHRAGEGIARGLTRKRFLDKTAVAAFGAFTSAALGFHVPKAFGTGPCPNSSDTCSCHPLNGLYCTSIHPSMCNGANCDIYTCSWNHSIYPDSCWCSKCCSGSYWKCCDCTCPLPGGGQKGCTCRGSFGC